MTLGELITNGGWAMYPIYACSVLATAIFLKKWLEFKLLHLGKKSWFEPILLALKTDSMAEAKGLCDQAKHPASKIVGEMITTYQRRPDRVEAEAARVGSLELQSLEKNLAILSFIAQVAPLLGLLGTVIGMVQLFMGLQGAGMASVDAAMLSSGIWKALLTTAAGLMVAVPSLAAYSFLTSITDATRLVFKDIIVQVQHYLPEPTQLSISESKPAIMREVSGGV